MGFEDKKPDGKIETPPEALALGGAASTPTLPSIAEKADDLEEIKKAVEDAAAVSGGLWLSYLFVLSYIAIAAGAVTHEDLLLVRPVKLPFLNVELPLKAFFALAPFVVLIIHAYALMHFIMLGKKASRFHTKLRRQFPAEGAHKDIRDKLRRLLPSNIFVQILAGPPELRTGIFGFMLKLIALTTLVAFPVLVLLLLQIQFLPFHGVRITNAQRAALFLDIVLLWLLRPPVLADISAESSKRARFFSQQRRGFAVVPALILSLVALWLSIVVATIPGEWQETALAALDRPLWQISYVEGAEEKARLVTTHDRLFTGDVDETTRRRKSVFSNTLVLPGLNLYEALKITDPKQLGYKKHLFDLRGRHLENAVLDDADIWSTDLTGAWLQGASLNSARLQGASLHNAQLQGAALEGAQLQGAQLKNANLEGALLKDAQLQGASLKSAQLQSASLDRAQLQGTMLQGAQLQGASLDQAQLQEANLEGARLEGAALGGARLQGASFIYAQLQGAWLLGAQLEGAILNLAQLQGAALSGARLQCASLKYAQLQGASLDGAWLQGADFYDAELHGATFDNAHVSVVSFNSTVLWRSSWGTLNPSKPEAIQLDNADWKPLGGLKEPFGGRGQYVPPAWDAKAYENLRGLLSNIPEGKLRDDALKRVETLDCGNPEKTLASCDPAAMPPPQVLERQMKLGAARVDEAAFAKALAAELQSLVCANDADAIHILRGVNRNERFAETGREAPALVDFIMSRDCPVSAALTDGDKARLLKIKQDAEKKFPSPAASKQDK